MSTQQQHHQLNPEHHPKEVKDLRHEDFTHLGFPAEFNVEKPGKDAPSTTQQFSTSQFGVKDKDTFAGLKNFPMPDPKETSDKDDVVFANIDFTTERKFAAKQDTPLKSSGLFVQKNKVSKLFGVGSNYTERESEELPDESHVHYGPIYDLAKPNVQRSEPEYTEAEPEKEFVPEGDWREKELAKANEESGFFIGRHELPEKQVFRGSIPGERTNVDQPKDITSGQGNELSQDIREREFSKASIESTTPKKEVFARTKEHIESVGPMPPSNSLAHKTLKT